MRILLIAGLSNSEIRKHLTFTKDRKLYHELIKLFHLPERVGEFRDTTPWVESIIRDLIKRDGIELHLMAPHIRLKKAIEEFEMNGVTYHYYRSEWTSLLRKLNNYKLWKRLQRTGYYTKKILKSVNPDIIVLSGTENPVTSVSFFSSANYPFYCLCQTIYNNPERFKYSKPNKLILNLEQDIVSKLQYFGVYCKMHYEVLKQMRSDVDVFKFGYPTTGVLLEPTKTEKIYDFVNFAMNLDLRKGAHDSVKAIAIVKQKYPNVTLNLVGGCDPKSRTELDVLIEDLGLKDNVIFTPFFEKRKDVLLHIQKSRFAVLPCKLDHTSGTMTQSMQLRLPLVVYKTTGTPAFNRDKECVLIAEKGNVEELAQHMLTLLEQPEKAEQLAKNAREYQEMRVEYNKDNGDRLIANFKVIIENYHYGTTIPQNQLFNPETDD